MTGNGSKIYEIELTFFLNKIHDIFCRVALQFTHEMQLKSQKNWDASKDQQQPLPVFGVGVAFIDERAFYSANNSEIDEAIEEIRLTVSTLFPPAKQLYVEPIEKLFSLDLIEGRARLRKLLDTIDDPTGKDDFLHYLRDISLQKVFFFIAQLNKERFVIMFYQNSKHFRLLLKMDLTK